MSSNSKIFEQFLLLGIEAIIFDCDGVLVDTESIKYEAWRSALEEQGIDNYTLDYHVHYVGLESKTMLQLLSKELGRELPASIITRKREIYAEIKNDTTPMHAMVAIVKKMYALKDDLHIKIWLASGEFEKNIRHNLWVTWLEDVFEVIVSGSEHLGVYIDPEWINKPKPYIYLEAAKQLWVLPTKCIVIEDTAVGVQAAKDAGMKVIAVPNKYSEDGDFSKADYIYPVWLLSFKGLMESIISLTENMIILK